MGTVKKTKKTVSPLDESIRGVVKVTASTALKALGADWGWIQPYGSLSVLGINAVPVRELFGDDEAFVDCSEYFFKRGYLPAAEKVLCAKPYRAYVELVYNRLLSKKPCRPVFPETYVMEPDEVKTTWQLLERLKEVVAKKHPEKLSLLESWMERWKKGMD